MTEPQSPLVFVGYPSEFSCYEKFQRKVVRIVSRLEGFQFACCLDQHEFLPRLQKELTSCKGILHEDLASLIPRLTHAIVFNAHGDLDSLIEELAQHSIETRVVQLSLVKVVNVDKDQKYDLYIGRGSTWGNPYAIGFDGDREEVIRKFSYDFSRGFLKFTKDDVLSLRGKRLGCHCKPSSCLGDVLADFVNSIDDGA